MNDQERQSWKSEIDAMSAEDMRKLWRGAPIFHPIFEDNDLGRYFESEMNRKLTMQQDPPNVTT